MIQKRGKKVMIIGVLVLSVLCIAGCKAKNSKQLKREARMTYGAAKVISETNGSDSSTVVMQDKLQAVLSQAGFLRSFRVLSHQIPGQQEEKIDSVCRPKYLILRRGPGQIFCMPDQHHAHKEYSPDLDGVNSLSFHDSRSFSSSGYFTFP